ncbi:hypothetical protein BH11PLA1_BH11PLA1_10530 [soil metagenome]
MLAPFLRRFPSGPRCAPAFALLFALAASPAAAQLTAARLYSGVNRPLLVNVELPAAAGGASIALYDFANAEVARRDLGLGELAQGGAGPRSVDLITLFPQLRSAPTPRALRAQLEVADIIAPAERGPGDAVSAAALSNILRPVGAPLVLQPMNSPARAELDDRIPAAQKIVFPAKSQPEKPTFTGYRVYVEKTVMLTTSAGTIEMRLRPDAAPNTAWNFRHLVEGGFFDGTTFHRVVPVGRTAGKGFVIQGGDPTGTGEGTPGYEIPFEKSDLPHDFGVISMARDPGPNTAGAQFFIALSREETARLDGLYTAFAQTLAGPSTQTIGAIAAGNLLPGGDRPAAPVTIVKVELVDAPPVGQGKAPAKLGATADR